MKKRNTLMNVFSFFISLSVFLFSASSVQAKSLTYIKEYSYQASELDSKVTSRTVALAQVKKILLEELGTYLVSESAVKDFELTKDQVSSLTAGIVMTVILDERWDGKTYTLRVKMTADTEELIKSINSVRNNQSQAKDLSEIREKTDEALRKIEILKKEMERAGADRTTEEKYVKAVSELNSIDWYKKGYALRYTAKNNQEAMKAFDKVIEIDPGNAKAYAARAAIYNEWGQYSKGLKESEKAVSIDRQLAWAFHTHGWAHIGMNHTVQAIADFNKAIELDPQFAWSYSHRSWAYFLRKDYQQALADADKAVQLDPELYQAYFRKGKALAALNNIREAIKNFTKAIELNPEFSWSYLQRAYSFLKTAETSRAMDDFRKAAAMGNDEAKAYLTKKGIQW
ncbi:MAG: tetratricopeptide repeat protein [Smithella sp.]